MAGTLHVVATPIGNLEDITLRALRVLREVMIIAAEDTRHSAKLLARYGIPTPTVSYHEHNRRSRLPQLISRLTAGEDIALITDAGTPAVSDPGAELVHACVQNDIPVNPVPGVSAPLAAAIASGFPLIPLTIYGFAPHRAKDRFSWLSAICIVPHTFCYFESPVRIEATLRATADILGERQICVARELTKAHQQFLRGPANLIALPETSKRGEFTIVVGPATPTVFTPVFASDEELRAEFGRLTDVEGLTRRVAINSVAKRWRRSAREVYAAVERAKASGL